MEWEVLESEGLCGNKKTLSCATNQRAEDREGLYFAVREIDGPLKVIGNNISKGLHDQSQAPSLKGNRFRVVMFRKTLRRCWRHSRLHGSYKSNPLFSAQNFYSFVFLVLTAKPQGYEGTNKATITPSLLSSRHKSSVESQHSPPGKVLCPLLRKPTPKEL